MLPKNSLKTWTAYVRARLRLSGVRSEREAAIVEDLARQLNDAYHDAIASGVSESEACVTAERHIADWTRLGHLISRVEEERNAAPNQWREYAKDRDLRKHGRLTWLTDILQDATYGLRLLRKSPGFTAIAVLTLALGIGANTAIFSLIDAVLLHSLPVANPSGLVLLKWDARDVPTTFSSWSYGDCESKSDPGNATGCSFSKVFLEDVRTKTDVFTGIAEFGGISRLNMTGSGPAALVSALYVSGDYFETLGIGPAAGRTFRLSDDSISAASTVVLNFAFWKSAFGGDPGVVGRKIQLRAQPFTIVGVADAKFAGLTPGNVFDVWVPLSQRANLQKPFDSRVEGASSWWVVGIGRLKPGVSRVQAESKLTPLFFDEVVHADKPMLKAGDAPRIELLSPQTSFTGAWRRYSTTLFVLMVAVSVVLIIACANVAGLMLARAAVRKKEIAVRLALGAGRARVMRQLLTESVMLSVSGGSLGIFLAFWGARALLAFLSSRSARPLGVTARIDLRVLLFATGISVLTGILFGLAPALRSMRVDLTPSLNEGTWKRWNFWPSGRRWANAGSVLVVAQLALTVVVLVGAALLVRTLENLKSVDPGFSTQNILNFGVDSTPTGYRGQRLTELYGDLQQRFAAIPRVISATYSTMLLLGGSSSTIKFHVPGTPEGTQSSGDYFPVGPNFFETMNIGIVEGREFAAREFRDKSEGTSAHDNAVRPSAPTIVNQTFVHAYFPTVNPVGQVFGADTDASFAKARGDDPKYVRDSGMVIVGVVRDTKVTDLRREVRPTIYLPSGGSGEFELRTAGDPLAIVPAVRDAVRQISSSMPVFDVTTESKQIDGLLFQERLIARMSSLFAILALLLACMGLFGLLSYEVSRRTQEIGVRMALGADGWDILRNIVGHAFFLVTLGATIGTGVSFLVTRYLKTMLFEVSAGDPYTLAGVMLLLAVVALAACYVPARRATRVDPLVALRYE